MAAPTKAFILWQSVVSGSMCSCDDTAAGYSATNLANEYLESQSRTADDSGKKTWTIDLGSGNTASYDTFAIAGHNFSSAGAFQVGRSFSSPVGFTTISNMTENTYIYSWNSPTVQRYIQFTASEDTDDDYLKIGAMWVGLRLELGRNPQIPIKILDDMDSLVLGTAGGQKLAYRNYYRRGYDLSFIVDFNPTMYGALKEMHDNRGFCRPYFFRLQFCSDNEDVLFGKTTAFDFSIDGKDMRPGTWKIIEEK